MTNPRMLERNRIWKRRLTAVGLAGFVALSALIGKQAEISQAATPASIVTTTQDASTTIASTNNPSSASIVAAPASATTGVTQSSATTASASSTTVHTRTKSS